MCCTDWWMALVLRISIPETQSVKQTICAGKGTKFTIDRPCRKVALSDVAARLEQEFLRLSPALTQALGRVGELCLGEII